MDREEKLNKICKDFTLLNDEQQDYILGILQALVFAKNNPIPTESKDNKTQNRI
ncbi:MAG: hypothetical protein LBU88_06015 [Treponema sp.]|nr:hypothetical protein [Treponema sp.]